jgi:hypothetical protein
VLNHVPAAALDLLNGSAIHEGDLLKKLTVVATSAALALSLPAASVADHGERHGPKNPCPAKSQGKANAKGHDKKAKQDRGKGRKCGHRQSTPV